MLEITRIGRHRLQRADGTVISEHTDLKEAYERAAQQPPGLYTLVTADERIEVKPMPFILRPVALPTVTLAGTDTSASETGPTTGTATVTRTGATDRALDVQYSRTGTATSGSDYLTLSGTVQIVAGQASAIITVTPIDDAGVESAETVILTLLPDPDYLVGSPSVVTVTITDNDVVQPPPSGDHPRTIYTVAKRQEVWTRLDTDAVYRTRFQTALDQFWASGNSLGNGDWKGATATVAGDGINASTHYVNRYTGQLACMFLGLRDRTSTHGITWPSSGAANTPSRGSFDWWLGRLRRSLWGTDSTNGFMPTVSEDEGAIAIAAMAYDLLYDEWTPQELIDIQNYLAQVGGTYLAASNSPHAWDDQTTTEHWAQVLKDMALEDFETRIPIALTQTIAAAETRVYAAFNANSYENKDSYPSNVIQAECLWMLRESGGYSAAQTTDLYMPHLQDAWQLNYQLTIPHPGATTPYVLRLNQTGFEVAQYQQNSVREHTIWAALLLTTDKIHTAATDFPVRNVVPGENIASQSTLCTSAQALRDHMRYVIDQHSLWSTTANDTPLNFAICNSNYLHNIHVFIPWIVENVQLPSATPKTGAEAGLPKVRRWWGGTLEFTLYRSALGSIKNSLETVISYFHKRRFCNTYEGNCHWNGSWQVHRGGPLYLIRGVESHGTPQRRQTNMVNGGMVFWDNTESIATEFQQINADDCDMGGVRMNESGKNKAEILADPFNDFGAATWYADTQVCAITSNLTRSYNSTFHQHGNPSVNQVKFNSANGFIKEWVMVQEDADGTDRAHLFIYDRIELIDTKFEPRLAICPHVEMTHDGVEVAHTPWFPDFVPNSGAWQADGPTRWDITGATYLTSSNATEPAAGTGALGRTISTTGTGKVLTKFLLPSSVKMYKRGGFNVTAATVEIDSGNSYHGAPWFRSNGSLCMGEGRWTTDAGPNDLVDRSYCGPWTYEVAPTTSLSTVRYLYVTDVMHKDAPVTLADYASLTCDSNSIAARCGASAVVFSKENGTRASGSVSVPAGVTLVVLVNLPVSVAGTVSGAGVVSYDAVSSNTGVRKVTTSGAAFSMSFS